MAKHESKPLDIDQEHLAYVQFEDMEPLEAGAERPFQYQPSRDRVVYWNSKQSLVAVEFLKDVDGEIRQHSPKADLRDLVLGETGVTEDDLDQLLQDSGIMTIMPPPRYKTTTQSRVNQDNAPE